MDDTLLESAATNFHDAQSLPDQIALQRICLGLKQVARAAQHGSRHTMILDSAASNFDAAGGLSDGPQLQRMALGLMQFARGLKH